MFHLKTFILNTWESYRSISTLTALAQSLQCRSTRPKTTRLFWNTPAGQTFWNTLTTLSRFFWDIPSQSVKCVLLQEVLTSVFTILRGKGVCSGLWILECPYWLPPLNFSRSCYFKRCAFERNDGSKTAPFRKLQSSIVLCE